MSRTRLGRLMSARHRRLIAALAGLLAVMAVVVVFVVGAGSSSPRSSTDPSAASGATTTVRRRNLVQTDTVSGTLSYANQQTVYGRLSGTITWLPAIGQAIRPGRALYRVSAQPVILMDGTTPAYRDLNSYDGAGQDILQLNRDLVKLGFNPERIVVDDLWQPATTAGVERFQESLDESQTGDLTLGQIVFLPGRQLVSAVDATLGSDVGGATAMLQTTSTRLVANLALDASKQSEAKVGEKVTIEMPAGNTVTGTITAVSPVAQSHTNNGNGNGNNGNGSSDATVPVTITLSGHHDGAGLDQAAVSVNLAQNAANNVLSVPVTALLATTGGGYAVQQSAAPHRLIPVATGLFAAGYVQISGRNVYPGLAVTDAEG